MRFGPIDIPEEILDAQENGTLVIFAGAGVSSEPPAGLPDFKKLVKQISGSNHYDEKDVPDQFLGKLEKKGVDIHGEARRILMQGDPTPNKYHRLIPRLFPKKAETKIVTTNQDELLLKGARELWEDVTVYEAPALPVGDDFTGLVFLHGSVRQEPRHMVLTDADFSRAYLTEGWARRFLLKLFETHTVLFIGYSHDDTVIRYLARGLPVGEKRRFAFTCDEGKAEHWSHLGVETIWYQKPHENLLIGLQKWTEVTAMGALEHRSRIITLAEAPPPNFDHERDYLKRRLRDPSAVAIFVKHAKHPEWIPWVAGQKLLEPLFTADSINDDRIRDCGSHWAGWLADLGIGEGYVEALNTVREKNSDWNRILWFAVAQALHYHQDIPHDRFNHWVRALLASPLPSGGTSNYLGYALVKCKDIERTGTALLLFDNMTRPFPKLAERIALYEEDGPEHIRWEVSFPDDDYWIREAWNKLFTPELGRFANRVLSIAEANMKLTYEIMQLTSDDFDSFDYRRYHIADRQDNGRLHYNGVVDVLIDAIRDCLRWLMVNRSDEGLAVVRRYLRSDHALFPRLALDALTSAGEAASPDDMLTWILDANLIDPHTESSELSEFLERIYPRASIETRTSILERIDARYVADPEGDDDRKKWFEQARLAMLGHLAKAAPDCKETNRRWGKAKEGIPEEQLPTGAPGERHEPKVEWIVSRSPYTKEKLLAGNPTSILETYDNLQQEDFWGRAPDKNGLENQVREVAGEDITFGLSMAEALSALNKVDHPLWRAILQGWRTALIQEAEWESIIRYLEKNFEVLAYHHNQAADFLKAAIENEDRRPPFALLPRLERLADCLWERVEKLDDRRILSDADWITHAINSTAGTLTMFWLHALSWRRKESGSAWRGLPDDYQKQLDRIIDSDTYGAQMGQVILGGQLHFLAYLDETWARERMASLFDFNSHEDRAYRVWSGFSLQGQMSPAVVDILRPHFQNIFRYLTKFSDDERRGIAQRIAAVVHHEGANWWRDGLLAEFIAAAEESDRVEFTETLGRFWETYNEDKRKEVWAAWISGYIQNRKSGKPAHFSAQEIGGLATWIFPFSFMAAQFVDAITSLPEPDLRHGHIFHRLEDSDLPEKAPKATLHLISWLLKGAKRGEFWEGAEVLKIVQRLIDADVERAELSGAIGEQCVSLGLDKILDLISSPDSPAPEP